MITGHTYNWITLNCFGTTHPLICYILLQKMKSFCNSFCHWLTCGLVLHSWLWAQHSTISLILKVKSALDGWITWVYVIWASTRESLSSGFANNKGADQPAHPRSMISAFVICFLKSIISKLGTGEISIF